MKLQWNGKIEGLKEKNLSQRQFVHQKSHTDCPGGKPGSLLAEAGKYQ
jgi:hypothetical protein